MSVVASASVCVAKIHEESEPVVQGACVEPPVWTVEANFQNKMNLRQQWTEEFRENVDKVAEAVATSIYNQFSNSLSASIASPFTRCMTADAPFREGYDLSLNSAQTEKWAGEAGKLPPFREWFTLRAPREADQKLIESRTNILGERVAALIKQKFDAFTEQDGNLTLLTEVKWNPKQEGNFLASKGPSRPCLRISAWMDEESVSAFNEAEKTQLEQLKHPAQEEPVPAPRRQNQEQPIVRLLNAISRFFSSLLYPLRWLFGR